LHTPTALAPVSVDHGGDDLLCVKGNQGRLYEELAVYFADPHATARTVTTVDRQRGRTAPRTLQASTRLSAYLARSWARSGGKGSAPSPADRARSHGAARGCKRCMRRSIVYVIPSLTPRRADPARLLALIRGQARLRGQDRCDRHGYERGRRSRLGPPHETGHGRHDEQNKQRLAHAVGTIEQDHRV